MDRKTTDLANAAASPGMIDIAIRVGLVALLVYGCVRIVLPFAFLLIWSAILSVMLHPLHLRLALQLVRDRLTLRSSWSEEWKHAGKM